jgi:tetratricopeptide (TPR) repeat protein
VLTGSVRPDGDQVKLTIELLDATDARQLWTRQYVRDQRNILAVQGEIAEEVATRMNLAPGSGAARARTASRLVDPAAYDLYLQGREALARRDLPQAIALFQTAITADAGLAEAHAGLAEVLILSAGGESGSADPRVLAQARQQADIAAASDPDLPDAELALASTSVSLLETLKHLRRSVELDGSYAEAYHKIGVEIMQFDPARAIGWYRKAIELDPRMDNVHRDAANAYTLLDRFADAEQELNKAGRGRPWWNWMAAKIQFEQSRFERGIAILGADRGFARYPPVLMMYASALASTGRTHEALGLIADAAAGSSALCERDAMVAALESETGAGLNAAKRVAQILDNATSAGGFTPNYSCAALAFAGAGRGDLSAGWLKRLAQDEPSLRQWATVSIVSSPAMALRRRWYPWNKVANGPALVEAERTLQDAYARLRADAATVLSGW